MSHGEPEPIHSYTSASPLIPLVRCFVPWPVEEGPCQLRKMSDWTTSVDATGQESWRVDNSIMSQHIKTWLLFHGWLDSLANSVHFIDQFTTPPPFVLLHIVDQCFHGEPAGQRERCKQKHVQPAIIHSLYWVVSFSLIFGFFSHAQDRKSLTACSKPLNMTPKSIWHQFWTKGSGVWTTTANVSVLIISMQERTLEVENIKKIAASGDFLLL